MLLAVSIPLTNVLIIGCIELDRASVTWRSEFQVWSSMVCSHDAMLAGTDSASHPKYGHIGGVKLSKDKPTPIDAVTERVGIRRRYSDLSLIMCNFNHQ